MLKLGIAGLRHPHIETIVADAVQRPDVALVAISEPDPQIRAEAGDRFGTPAYESHTGMLAAEDLDAIGVGAVYAERGQIVAEALRAGVHVIADKPLCTSLSDLDAIESAWTADGPILSMALEKRFYPATLAADGILDELGALVFVTASAPHKLLRERRPAWFFDPVAYGGILNDLAVHDVDLLLHFTGAHRGTVRGYAGNAANADRPGFQDHGMAVLEVEGGPVATLEVHWMSPEAAEYHGDYRMRLTGTQGTAELLWKDGVLHVATHTRPPRDEPLPVGLRPAQDFFDALATGRKPRISAADSFAATRVALLAQESSRARDTLRWDLDR